MRRRDVLAAAIGAAVWPHAARAQPSNKVARIGYLSTRSIESPESVVMLDALRKGLRERGYVEGQNIVVEVRGADGKIERFPARARELVDLMPDVIVASNSLAARAVQQATSTILIVVPVMGDPVGDGLVASLARPGRNITGLTFLGPALVPKRLGLLKEALPTVSRVAALWHPGAYGERTMTDMMQQATEAARSLDLQLQFMAVQGPDELDGAFSRVAGERVDALLVFPSPMLFTERRHIADLAMKHRLPSMAMGSEFVQLGGLLSYGASISDLHYRAAAFVDQILKGAAGLGGFAVVRAAIGQTRNLPLIGFLNAASADTYRFNADSFRKGLRQAGFIEGQNVRIEERWANGDYNALPRLAADLVSKGVVAMAAIGDVASAQAAKEASSSVPVVFTIGADPVRFGLVESLNHPGGHVTGIHLLSSLLGAKRVELLHQLSPQIRRIALLMNRDNRAAAAEQADAEAGARVLGLETVAFNARNAREIASVFGEILREKVDSLFGATDPIILDQREQIVSFANREALPAVYFVRQFAVNGGLLTYGPSITWMYEQAGRYIGQILNGDKPANMPVLQPTGFEFVVNLKTAQALGLDVPPTLLARADEVIE